LKLKLFISFVLLVVGTFSLTAQSYNYSYTDPCTGNAQNIVVPINGEVAVGYYGFVETFSYAEFNDGTFDTWTNSVFSQFEGSPCAEIVGITSTVNIAQNAAFDVVNILNSLSALSDFAKASGATDMLTGSISAASNSSGSSEDDEENNESNGSSTNQNSQTSTGSNQVNSGTSGNTGTNGSTGENPAGTGTPASTPTGSTETGSQTTGQSVGSGETNNQTANGNTNESNSSVNSGESSGNGNVGGGSGNSENSQESQETGVNNTSNTETNQTQNGNGNTSSTGSTTSSSNSSSSEGNGSPTNEETPSQTEGQGKTNITAGATKTINANKENGNGAPTVIASGDFVGFNFKNSEVTTGLKLTGGYHSLRWDGARAHGVMVDYVSAINGPNTTAYYAWIKPKSISMLSLTGTLGFEGRGSLYGTIAAGQMLLFPKVKNLKAVYMGTISYGQVYKTSFMGSALIAGGMYDVRALKRIDIKLMGLFVYVPYISYYNDLVLKSPYVVIPSIGTNIAITKRFKFNINAGGAWAIKEKALNYTVTCGTRLLVGQ
jgi:hypothetical protein